MSKKILFPWTLEINRCWSESTYMQWGKLKKLCHKIKPNSKTLKGGVNNTANTKKAWMDKTEED